MSQPGPAGVGEFIQRQASACNSSEDGEHAGAGRRLEHQVIDTESSGLRDDGCERQGG